VVDDESVALQLVQLMKITDLADGIFVASADDVVVLLELLVAFVAVGERALVAV